tara:strand:- start:7769 stop:8185 length:417 start_codon:yes stop_codon:yes gene_type:complete
MPSKKTQSSKTSPKKRASSKSTKKVEKLSIADGKSDIQKAKDLEELLGVKQVNPFGTTNKAILEERMNEMTLTDLQTFAIKVGILPSGNKLSLKNKLLRAFKSHAGAGAGYNTGFSKPLIDPDSKAAEEILKISQEGF